MPDSPAATVSFPERQRDSHKDVPARNQSSGAARSKSSEAVWSEKPGLALAALADSPSRGILVTTANRAQSVSDIVTNSQISRATAYRKVQRLVDAGLLREHIRIKCDGPNVMEYQLAVKQIQVTFDACGNPAVKLITQSTTESQQEAGWRESQMGTECGESESETERESLATPSPADESFNNLFTELTGKTVMTQPQEGDSRRYFSDDQFLTARELHPLDGLAEAYPDMDPELFE